MNLIFDTKSSTSLRYEMGKWDGPIPAVGSTVILEGKLYTAKEVIFNMDKGVVTVLVKKQ